jgi:hypothetical protein
MKLTPSTLENLIKERLEVVLTDAEAVELFGDSIKEERGFGEGTPADDGWSEKEIIVVEEDGSQLELPGMESPPLCEPEDGVDDLSSQLAQMVVDSGMPPEELNDLMGLIYDKVSEDLEGIGIEDSDEYRRTTMGFMEALRKATLKEIMDPEDVGPSGTLSMDADEPKEDPAATIETEPVSDEYSESHRLFKHFFGKYDEDALKMLLSDPTSQLLKQIVMQLYGWGIRGYSRRHNKPGTASIKIAQEFEAEGKEIEGNEELFRKRVEGHIGSEAKKEFDLNIAQRQPARNVKASPSHIQKALGKWVQQAQERDPRSSRGQVAPTQELEEMIEKQLYIAINELLAEQGPPDEDETMQEPQVAAKQAASEEAQSAAQSANPGTPQTSGEQAGHAEAEKALSTAAQSGGQVFTGGEESTTVGTGTGARKEDEEELDEKIENAPEGHYATSESGKRLSKKPKSKKEAIKQLVAVEASKEERKAD